MMMIFLKNVALVSALALTARAQTLLGASYCNITSSPDFDCYADGFPTCCGGNVTCPLEQPSCELGNATSFGGDYCFRGSDPSCYVSGLPRCCESPDTRCPPLKPSCEMELPLDGADYCTFAPDGDCYMDGWPTCCSIDNVNSTCPDLPPSCEVGTPTSFGGDYCRFDPDFDCYANGVPICCWSNIILGIEVKCPRTMPECEIETLIEV